tara:strand:- start:80 stop:616 length:537 start_codon:yes stop_codon:yes gene_type:complete
MQNFYKNTRKINSILIIILFSLNSCGGGLLRPADVKDVPVNEADRVEKNMETGRGFKLFGGEDKGGVFQFASSNPLWRASLDILDFIPLTNVSYSGGIIITDWYSENNDKNESIKIIIKFLSNEIRPDAIDILVYKKNCKSFENCQSFQIKNAINQELKLSILKKASLIEKLDLAKKK